MLKLNFETRNPAIALDFDGKQRKIFRSALVLAAETSLVLGHPAEALGYLRDVHAKAAVDSLAQTRSAYVGEARLVEARALLVTGDTSSARATLASSVIALRNGAGPGHPRTLEICLVQQRRGIERDRAVAAPQVYLVEPVQLSIKLREQLISRLPIGADPVNE